jgi:hypothetical protein
MLSAQALFLLKNPTSSSGISPFCFGTGLSAYVVECNPPYRTSLTNLRIQRRAERIVLNDETFLDGASKVRLPLSSGATGDWEALAMIFNSNRPRLHRAAAGLIRNPEDIEDIVQESIIATLRHWNQFEGRAAPLTWVQSICDQPCPKRVARAEESDDRLSGRN